MHQIAAILPSLQSEIHLLVNFCLKTKDHHSTTPLVTKFSTVSLVSFPKTQDGVKGKKIYNHHDSRKPWNMPSDKQNIS